MHGGGTVALRTRVTGNQVVVEVTDEGPGVAAELGARIFERTVSGRNSTGLGLAVARDLAEADGGRLELLQQRRRSSPCSSPRAGGARRGAGRGAPVRSTRPGTPAGRAPIPACPAEDHDEAGAVDRRHPGHSPRRGTQPSLGRPRAAAGRTGPAACPVRCTGRRTGTGSARNTQVR